MGVSLWVRHVLGSCGVSQRASHMSALWRQSGHVDPDCARFSSAILRYESHARYWSSVHLYRTHVMTTMIDDIQSAPLIWINAFPGTGKYTIASILTNKLMEGQCTLIHNHDLIDAVSVPRDHPMYRMLRKEERAKAFAQHVLAPRSRGRCVVFTGMSM